MKLINLIFLIFIILIIGIGIYLVIKPNYNIKNLNSQGKNLICFGDSLTQGVGALTGQSYPDFLAENLPFPVINAGKAGDTTFDALARIDWEVIEKDPFLVIIEFGANDYLKGIQIENTIKNLEKIIDKIQQAGAAVVILEVKVTFPDDKYLPSLEQLVKQKQVYLISDALNGIYQNKTLMSSDNMHPNEYGYKILAEKILKEINPILKKMGKH